MDLVQLPACLNLVKAPHCQAQTQRAVLMWCQSVLCPTTYIKIKRGVTPFSIRSNFFIIFFKRSQLKQG